MSLDSSGRSDFGITQPPSLPTSENQRSTAMDDAVREPLMTTAPDAATVDEDRISKVQTTLLVDITAPPMKMLAESSGRLDYELLVCPQHPTLSSEH